MCWIKNPKTLCFTLTKRNRYGLDVRRAKDNIWEWNGHCTFERLLVLKKAPDLLFDYNLRQGLEDLSLGPWTPCKHTWGGGL